MGKNNKDKGFTLIELVISVAILAIVTAPLLNSFVIAAKNNATANARQIVTNYSESVMEKFKATSFEMLTEEFTLVDKAVIGDHEGEKYYYYDAVNDYYMFNVPGTELTGGASSNYNVNVKMTPQKYDAPNLADVDGTKTAMFISEVYKYDDIVLSELEAQMTAIPDANKSSRYQSTNPDASNNLRESIKRTTYVTLTYGTGTTPYSVQLDVMYECTVGTGRTVSKTYEKIFLNNYENVPDILMFYTPYPYKRSTLYMDKVYINNAIPTAYIPRDDKCKVFIANQKVSEQSGSYLYYYSNHSGNFIFQEDGSNKDIYSENMIDGLVNTEVFLSESIINTAGHTNSLVGTREAIKMYDITVDVYWNGDLASSVSSSTDGQN